MGVPEPIIASETGGLFHAVLLRYAGDSLSRPVPMSRAPLTPEDVDLIQALIAGSPKMGRGLSSEPGAADSTPVLHVLADMPEPMLQRLQERLAMEDLSPRIVLIDGATVARNPKNESITTHLIKAIQEREATAIRLIEPREPAWKVEQHNRKPSPRRR